MRKTIIEALEKAFDLSEFYIKESVIYTNDDIDITLKLIYRENPLNYLSDVTVTYARYITNDKYYPVNRESIIHKLEVELLRIL